jgi:hypothetical protein
MHTHPTAEQFFDLSESFNRYSSAFCSAWNSIYDADSIWIIDEKALGEMTAAYDEISKASFESNIREGGERAFAWLVDQPGFYLACKSVGFIFSDEEGHFKGIERLISRFVGHRAPRNMAEVLAKRSGRYTRYISGVSLAAARYLSGNSVKEAIEGPATFNKMQDLIAELEKASSADWLPEGSRKVLDRHLKQISFTVARMRPPVPISKRNDPDLPSRLMAVELIKLHQEMFSATHKRAVFQLTGLPFIEKPLEFRTIERLARAEKEGRRTG